MRRTIALTIVLGLMLISSAFAGKALVRVFFESPQHMREVLQQFDDVAGWGGKRYADIVVSFEKLDELNAIAPNNETLIPDVDRYIHERGVLGVGSAYHTQEEAYAEMDSVATAHPDICQLQSIGLSIEGRDIWALKISDNVTVTEDEPRVLYLGCHHAREIITIEIPLYIMHYLVDNYGADSLATFLVDNREIWIVPILNPDGREYVENVGDWRKNRRDNGDGTYGVDLNRNYAYMWGYDDVGSSPNPGRETYRGTGAFSEPETQAIRDLMINYQFATCISYHSHGRLILYPWGYVPSLCPDDDIYYALCDSMASLNGYTFGPAATTIYPTNGDSDDWMYGEQVIKDKVLSMTFEVGSEFYPPESDIIPLCEENLAPSLLAAEFAGNLRRILAPVPPVITSMADDDDGNFTVAWTPDLSDSVNLPVAYALMERTGLQRVLDDVESGDIYWNRSKFKLSTSRAWSGTQSFYGGYTDSRDAKLTSLVGLDVSVDDTLFFYTWYDIEEDWDYAYVEVSTDGGAHFHSIPGNITTTSNPNGNNLGYGITGSSGGWVRAVFPLTSFADSTILIRFRYKTDSYYLEEGIYIDDIFPVETFDSSFVISDAITETHYDLSRPAGTYYYEVRAKDSDGQWGYWSQRESINVTGAGITPREKPDVIAFTNPVSRGSSLRLAGLPEKALNLYVVDIRGRLVRRIGVSPSGSGEWDLTDDKGCEVAPGIYFIKLDPGTNSRVFKVVVLK